MNSNAASINEVVSSPTQDGADHRIKNLKGYYNSDDHDLIEDFLVPCLEECKAYRRAAGFFSSSSLITWASILPKVARGDFDTIQIIMSPSLNGGDIELIEKCSSEEERSRLLQIKSEEILLDAICFSSQPDDLQLRQKLFCWLVANDKLQIKFAFSKDYNPRKLYHVKNGIFEFKDGTIAAFTGSLNESLSSHSLSNEEIDVFRSWVETDQERLKERLERFQREWTGHAKKWKMHDISPDTIKKIKEHAPNSMPLDGETSSIPAPKKKNKWRHQDDAIEKFLHAKRGILEMATGTGKTRTALTICRHLIESGQIKTVIVSTDGTDLLNQWYKEILNLISSLGTRRFNIYRHYFSHHQKDLFILNPTPAIMLASRDPLASVLRELPAEIKRQTLLIHDEVHGLGSPENRKNLNGLSDDIAYVLGLSATPEREYDTDGNDFIKKNVGDVIFNFDIGKAIQRGILSPFNYFPLQYQPNQDDRDKLQRVYAQQAVRTKEGKPMSDSEVWTAISDVYKTSRAKLPIFDEFISRNVHFLDRCIVFVHTTEYGVELLEILHKYRHDFRSYFAGESSDVLSDFAKGKIECLVTCHRLSEGIDIRSLNNVILFASSRARLETIQRIGRCIRIDPNNPNKRANVIDFIRTPSSAEGTSNMNADEERCQWLTELSRYKYEDEENGA